MKMAEIRQQEDKELGAMLRELRQELFNLEFQSASEQLENPSRIRQIRRDIARIETVRRERQLGIRGQHAV